MSKIKTATGGIDKKIFAVYTALKRPDTPLYAKLTCGMFVWYTLSPLDLIPDFIPVLGAIDDLIILPFLIWLAVRLIPEDIMRRCEIEAAMVDTSDRGEFLRYSIPVFIIWGLVAFWFIQTIAKYI